MKALTLTGHQSRLAQLFRDVLKILRRHNVLKTHSNPKAIYDAVGSFSADTIATLAEGEMPFRLKVVELSQLLSDYILAEIKWSAHEHDRFKAILDPLSRLETAVSSGEQLPEKLVSGVEAELKQGIQAISYLCRAIAQKLFDVLILLRAVWPQAQAA